MPHGDSVHVGGGPGGGGGGLSQAAADALYDALGAAAAAQAAAATDATTKADAAKARAVHTGTQAVSTILAAATSRIFGRITTGGGAGEELTAANVKTILALVAADISDLTAAVEALFVANGSPQNAFTEAVEDVIGTWCTNLGGSGLTLSYNDGGNSPGLDVNVDGSTLEISADTLRAKDGGITRAKLATALAQDSYQFPLSDYSTALTVGDGAFYWVVPSHLNGLKLKSLTIALVVAQSTSGTPTVQMANVTGGYDMLSTRPVIAINKWLDTETGGTAAVVDTASSHDLLTTGDRIRFDIDVAGTGSKGLIVSFYVGT